MTKRNPNLLAKLIEKLLMTKETILYLISKQERRSKLRKTKITHTCMIVFRFGYDLMQVSLSFRIVEKTLFKNSFFIHKKNHD